MQVTKHLHKDAVLTSLEFKKVITKLPRNLQLLREGGAGEDPKGMAG